MVSRIFWCTFLMLISVRYCLSEQVQLYARFEEDSTTGDLVSLGVLNRDNSTGIATVSGLPIDAHKFPEGKYCIGTALDGDFYCHNYVHLSWPLKYSLVLTTKKSDGEILSFGLVPSEVEGINVITRSAVAGAQPKVLQKKLGKSFAQANNAAQATADVDEEEEAPKSFLQKYWMYLVPAALMIIMSYGQEQQSS